MFSNEFSCIRRDMVSGAEEVGDFLLNLMDSERVAQFNSNLQHRNFVVIGWLEEHGAPAEMIAQAKEDAAQGNNAILTVYDEIRLGGMDYRVVPGEVLDLFLEAAGRKARALFIQLCQEYSQSAIMGGKDYREKQGRP